MNFEIGAQGQGAKYVARRARLRRRRLQPRGRHGRHRDVGAGQADDLPRAPHQAQHRRLGPPPRRLVVRDAAAGPRHAGLRDREHRRGRHVHLARACSAATRRRAPTSTTSSARTSTSRPQPARPTRSPTSAARSALLNAFGGEHELKQDPYTMMIAVKTGRPLPVLRPRGRRARRPAAAPDERDRGGRRRRPHLSVRWADRAYGRRRPRRRAAGSASSAPGRRREWWAEQRERILGAGPDRAGQGDVRRVDAPGAALGGRVPRLLGPARGLRLRRRHADGRGASAPRPGKVTPAGVGGGVPRPVRGLPARRTRTTCRSRPTMTKETLADLLDEKLAAARSRTSSPGSRTPTASTSGSRCCRSGSTTTTRSCCRSARA